MIIDIYMSTKNGDKYLSVPKGTKIESLVFPATVDQDILSLSPFRTRLEIEAGVEHNALDQKDIIQQIETQGYAIHGATRVISLSC